MVEGAADGITYSQLQCFSDKSDVVEDISVNSLNKHELCAII
jgi:hypothetical protein